MESNSILVVDDDEILRTRLQCAFERRGMQAYGADGVEEAVQIIKVHAVELRRNRPQDG